MRTFVALPAISLLLFALSGCTRKATPLSKAPTSDDRSEILMRHFLRRVSDLTDELGKRESEIAILRHAKRDPSAGMNALSERLNASNHRLVQNLLDNEDWIEEQNRRHPESPQADIKDLLRHMCGDCTRERTIRDSQLKEEAKKYEPADSRK